MGAGLAKRRDQRQRENALALNRGTSNGIAQPDQRESYSAGYRRPLKVADDVPAENDGDDTQQAYEGRAIAVKGYKQSLQAPACKAEVAVPSAIPAKPNCGQERGLRSIRLVHETLATTGGLAEALTRPPIPPPFA
jgi:hypothetical protein